MADVQTPPPAVTAHDPLPEANWFWRRVYIFVLSTVAIIGVSWLANWMHTQPGAAADKIIDHEYQIIRWILLLLWFSLTYYLVAPSAEQVTRMWQTASLFKSGVTSTITQKAVAADGSTAVATTTTGVGVTPTPDVKPLGGASAQTGLPVYTGPDLTDAPEPHPGTPEEPSWPA